MNKNSKNIRNELIKMEYRSCCSNMIYMTEENKSVLQKVKETPLVHVSGICIKHIPLTWTKGVYDDDDYDDDNDK